jgi:hypothetical protein
MPLTTPAPTATGAAALPSSMLPYDARSIVHTWTSRTQGRFTTDVQARTGWNGGSLLVNASGQVGVGSPVVGEVGSVLPGDSAGASRVGPGHVPLGSACGAPAPARVDRSAHSAAQSVTGPRRERAEVAQALRAQGETWVRIAELFRLRYKVNARVAYRYAHSWSQGQVARLWCERWPDDFKTSKNISYWELWPAETGRTPSLAILARLAELYECSVSDLLADLPNYRHHDRANGQPAEIDAVAGAAPREHIITCGDDAGGPDAHEPAAVKHVQGGAVLALNAGSVVASLQVTLSPDSAVTVRYEDVDRVAVVAGPVRLLIEAAGTGVPQLALPAAADEAVPGGARLYSISRGKAR